MPSIHHLLDAPDQHATRQPSRRPYDPVRKTPAGSVTVPISRVELVQCQGSANPLRTSVSSIGTDTHTNSANGTNKMTGPGVTHAGSSNADSSLGKRAREHDADDRRVHKQTMADNGDKAAVASHYNARPDIGIDARKESPIIGLKNFNNWIKTVLVSKFGRREGSRDPLIKVLDLGCGKGGDLQKWGRAGTSEYVGIDLAAVSIEQARQRWASLRNFQFPASFYVADCFETTIDEVIEPSVLAEPFDVVSMQFCMHYAFETKEKAHTMLRNVSQSLRPGGRFIGTIPDAENLLSRLEAIEDDSNLAFGNSVYGIKFDQRMWDSPFGHRYTFFLQDAVEEVPEYVVYWEEFVQMAAKYDLSLSYCSDFQQIFAAEKEDPHLSKLLQRMKVVNLHGETDMTVDQWEAATLYLGFAFTKGS
ncbi:hypothetical protein ACM66B_004829 [Microbotryomycetes sp. NB124-2]